MIIGSAFLRERAEEWYGDIPADWRVQRFKHLATIRNGQVDPEESDYRHLPLFAPNHIESGTGRLLGVESADEQGAESGKYLVRQGEIVYSKIRPALRKAALAPCDGLCSADMYPVAPRSHADARFLLFEMLSEGFSRYSVLESDRVAMPKINRDALGECPFVFPDLPRQRAIAAFLDRKTAAIDTLIAKKERLMELLQEKRQAVITQAVTKGLDANIPMKESGIYWLGRIPSHWKMEPNGRLFRETDERGLRDLPVLSVSLSTGVEERDFSEDRIQPKMSDFADYKVARRDDVVFNKMRMWQGAVGVAPVDGFVSPDYTVLRPGPESNPRFFSTLFRTAGYTCEVNRFSHGIALDRNRIYWDAFKSIASPVPPRPEQDAIVVEIQRLNDKLAERVAVLERGTALLREYRQSLISAAVTGKIEIPAEEAA